MNGRRLATPDDKIEQWKIDKIRNYYNGGWEPEKIATKLGVNLHEIVDILYTDPVQTTMMGHKSESYYSDEMDYLKFGSAPLPKYVILSD